jgi:HAD superfamily hydrolase (TIGR01509 family)
MPIRAVSLDLFDTLVDLDLSGGPMAESLRAIHETVAPYTALDLEAFTARMRDADRALYESRYPDGVEIATEERFAHLMEQMGIDGPDLVERLTSLHMGILDSRVDMPAHHADTLRRLRERAPVGLCSNFTHGPTARGILDRHGLTALLDPIVISVDVGIRKPRREIFDVLLQGLGAAPEETLHVGDNLRADVAGAARLGLRTAWLTRRVPDPEAARAGYDGPAPDYVVADLEELIAIVDGAGQEVASGRPTKTT